MKLRNISVIPALQQVPIDIRSIHSFCNRRCDACCHLPLSSPVYWKDFQILHFADGKFEVVASLLVLIDCIPLLIVVMKSSYIRALA
eukprot:scaffold13219_cov106-Skeletonema_marinoi.AAC.6